MKTRFLVSIIVITVVISVIFSPNIVNLLKADELLTYQSHWVKIRAEGDEDAATAAAALDLTTKGDYANKSATAFDTLTLAGDSVKKGPNVYVLAFAGDDTANETFSVVAYGYATENGPAEFLFNINCTLGTQAMVKYPDTGGTATGILWADTIALAETDNAPAGIDLVDESGSNRMSRLILDLTGLRYIKCYVYNANDATTEAGEVSIYMRTY